MSRSNPNEHLSNPAVRWMEWNGEKGEIRYYDKERKEQVSVGADFTFLLLDQLGCVGGWSDANDSAIYSNEVRDTRQDAMVVKSFKGGIIAEGLYGSIKDRVKSAGGKFNANCYVAFKHNGALAIGSLKFQGAALHAWAEFTKAHRASLDSMAVKIEGFTEGKKGRIVFRVPIFKVVATSPETDKQAIELDKQLQKFLTSYLRRNKSDQVESAPEHVSDEDVLWHDNPMAAEAIVDEEPPF